MQLVKGIQNPPNQMILSFRTQLLLPLQDFDPGLVPILPNITGELFRETETVGRVEALAYAMT
jgi:hypothetical protein